MYRDQFYIFFLFRTIPDTVSGLGFSVCYLLLSFHSKFRPGGVYSSYFTKPLRNPTQLDKLLLTISKMAEDTPKDRGNLFETFSQDLDLENEESDYSEMSDPNDPQYEPWRSDVDSDIDLDLDENDQPRPTNRSKPAVAKPKGVKQGAVSKGKGKASKAAKSTSVASTSGTRSREPILCSEGSDVDYSSDKNEHEETFSNPELDVDIAVADLSPEWNQDLNGLPSSIPDFSAQPGINTELIDVENASPISVFQLIFDDSMISHIKTETNRYAAELAS